MLVQCIVAILFMNAALVFDQRHAAVSASTRGIERSTSSRVVFEENRGQHHRAVTFIANGAAGNRVFLAREAVVFVAVESGEQSRYAWYRSRIDQNRSYDISPPRSAVAVYITLSGTDTTAEHHALGKLEHRTNLFIGNSLLPDIPARYHYRLRPVRTTLRLMEMPMSL